MAGQPDAATGRPPRPWRRAAVALGTLPALCLALAASAVASPARADVAACTRMVAEDAARLDRTEARRVQSALAAAFAGYADFPAPKAAGGPLGDGRLGRVSLQWLERFCRDYAVPDADPQGRSPADAVVRFAAVLADHPEWRPLLPDPALTRWIDARPPEQRLRFRHARLFGSNTEIAALLARWRPDTDSKLPPENDAELVYFELTAADLAWLEAPRQVLAALAKLVGKPPLNDEQFDATLAAIGKAALLPPGADELAVVREHVPAEDSFQLTDESIKALRVARVPAPIVALAQSVQDLPYPTARVLEEALRDAEAAAPKPEAPPPGLAGALPPSAEPPPPSLADQLAAIRAQVVRRPIYRITEKSLDALARDRRFRLPDPYVLAAAKGLKDVEYPSAELFVSAARARLVEPLLEKRPKGVAAPQGGAEADKPALQRALSKLSNIARAPASPLAPREFHEVVLKPSAALRELQVPEAWLALVDRSRDHGLDTARDLRELLFVTLDPQLREHMPLLLAAARKTHPFRQQGPIDWTGDDCGCVRTARLPGSDVQIGGQKVSGEVYGLFPLWQAGRAQRIDFSVLSSIAYFALPVDADGRLRDTLDGKDARRLEFAATARRHGTRVDWTIRRADWPDWAGKTRQEREQVFNRLAGDIEAMLVQTQVGWLHRLVHRLTLGAVPVPTRGDGVTLYFPNYPADADSVASFASFHRSLVARLEKRLGGVSAVNLLFSSEQIGRGIYECRHLYAMMEARDHRVQGTPGRFLVLLNEPTTDTKKSLRQKFENCATGRARQELLQNVVPVIVYATENLAQLQDDIVYFDFNFGGVALWPHPVATDVDTDVEPPDAAEKKPDAAGKKPDAKVTAAQVGGDIRELLLGQGDDDGQAVNVLDAGVDRICTVVCPNRWWFRGLLFLMAVVFAGSLVARWMSCTLRSVVASKPVYFWGYLLCVVAPTLLLFLGLLYCDPAWRHVREGNVPFLLLAAVFLGYVIWLYVSTRREASQP